MNVMAEIRSDIAGSNVHWQRRGRPAKRTLALVIFWALVWCATGGQATTGFTYDDVIAKARDQANRPYTVNGQEVPDFLLELSYDAWRDIRFVTDKSLWRAEKLPFEVQFFHPGLYYNRLVRINEISAAESKPIAFSPSYFTYGSNDFVDKMPAEFGFAGFRLHYALNTGEHLDEVAVFLGASYFRAVGKKQNYGLSARGLAIDTGLDTGEEFPYFKEFWLEKPQPGAHHLVVYGLLDSKSLTGAYRFSIRPGEETTMAIQAKIFRRKDVQKVGIAPLTSMFFYDESVNQRPINDFRPEIHDSDGLLVASASGEMIWRPLINHQSLFINALSSVNPRGFGLLQRDLDFDHYQDTEARYDQRPSAWVTTDSDWGPGHVELVQIPTDKEANDNIVAYWVPAQLPDKKDPIEFAYQLKWYYPRPSSQAVGQVIATRTAAGTEPDIAKLIVDFKGGKLAALPEKLPVETPLEAMIEVSDGGEVLEKQLYRVEPEGAWRLVFQVRRKDGGGLAEVLPVPLVKQPPVELRVYLVNNKKVLTETWSYAVWP